MTYENTTSNKAYFAAANGYSGFRSLFGEIFDPERFGRTFIIKGGPGTGKSTIMKKLVNHSLIVGYEVEEIYCSSDPHSLDGVIIRKNEHSIAVLDGTAPHERDCIYPGACDEIINLGNSFNIAALTEKKEEIIALGKSKKEAYKAAYAHLHIAGQIYNVASELLLKSMDYNKAERLISNCISECAANKSGNFSRVYRSAFSRFGHVKLDAYTNKKTVEIDAGDSVFVGRIFMNMLYQRLRDRGAICTIARSPFDDSIIEEIDTTDRIYSLMPASKFEKQNTLLRGCSSQLASLEKMHSEALRLAQDAFSEASHLHFKLEDIYKGAVDFNNNDSIYSSLQERITTELEKQ